MDTQDVIGFLEAINAENIKDRGNWVIASCPLASITHANGSDRHPSFGISVSGEAKSIWRCFTCQQEHQPLEFLLHKIWLLTKAYPKQAALFLSKNLSSDNTYKPSSFNSLNSGDKWSNWTQLVKPLQLPEYIVNFFSKLSDSNSDTALKLKSYLCSDRGINPGMISFFDIKFINGADYLIFPLQDASRRIQSFHARSIKEKKIFVFNRKFFDKADDGPPFPTPKTLGMWFGLNNLQRTQPVIITEGAIDAMKVASFGFSNVVASMTAGVTKAQILSLQAPYYVIGFDSDAAGQTAGRKLITKIRRLHGRVPVSVLDWSLIKYGGKPCKDAGEIQSKKDFQKIMQHAYHV